MRVLAGLWPFATGRICLPAAVQTLFLPQRPYMSIGTLREALWFPARPALARAFLLKPDWLFLDEATSALDEDQEAVLYRWLADALGRTTLVSIGHRRSLEAYHTRVLTIDQDSRPPGLRRAASPRGLRRSRRAHALKAHV